MRHGAAMLIAVPLGVVGEDGRVPRWAPVSHAVLVFVILVFLFQRWYLSLPMTLAEPLEGVLFNLAAWRLHADPTDHLFMPVQMWTYAAIHDGWWSLVLNSLAWWTLAPAVERRLGSLPFVLWLVVVIPLGVTVHLLAGQAVPAFGLAAVICGLAGAVLACERPARVRVAAAWWAVVVAGVGVVPVPVLAILGGFLLLEAARETMVLTGTGTGLDRFGVGDAFAVVQAINLALVFVGGHVLAQSHLQVRQRWWPQGGGLRAVAKGRRPLCDLPALAAGDPHPPVAILEQVGRRCRAEHDRAGAALILARLRQRAPQGPVARELAAWLAEDPEESDPCP